MRQAILTDVEIDSNETVETNDTLPLPRITSTPQVTSRKMAAPSETPISALPVPPKIQPTLQPPPPIMPRLVMGLHFVQVVFNDTYKTSNIEPFVQMKKKTWPKMSQTLA